MTDCGDGLIGGWGQQASEVGSNDAGWAAPTPSGPPIIPSGAPIPPPPGSPSPGLLPPTGVPVTHAKRSKLPWLIGAGVVGTALVGATVFLITKDSAPGTRLPADIEAATDALSALVDRAEFGEDEVGRHTLGECAIAFDDVLDTAPLDIADRLDDLDDPTTVAAMQRASADADAVLACTTVDDGSEVLSVVVGAAGSDAWQDRAEAAHPGFDITLEGERPLSAGTVYEYCAAGEDAESFCGATWEGGELTVQLRGHGDVTSDDLDTWMDDALPVIVASVASIDSDVSFGPPRLDEVASMTTSLLDSMPDTTVDEPFVDLQRCPLDMVSVARDVPEVVDTDRFVLGEYGSTFPNESGDYGYFLCSGGDDDGFVGVQVTREYQPIGFEAVLADFYESVEFTERGSSYRTGTLFSYCLVPTGEFEGFCQADYYDETEALAIGVFVQYDIGADVAQEWLDRALDDLAGVIADGDPDTPPAD